jgi:serine phosphatase RsbU (regulator of sigma subunit)
MAAGSSRRILVLDGDAGIRGSLCGLLQSSGLAPLALSTFDELAAAVPSAEVLLCNFRPGEGDSGVDILRRVRGIEATLPVILYGRRPAVRDVVEALRAGAQDVLTWPIEEAGILLLAVERAVETRRLREQNRRYHEQLEQANADLQATLARFHEDEEAGRRVQELMLPESPQQFGEVLIEHRVQPSFMLSGDFVDYFDIGEGRIAFYLADVSGHGSSSAFVTMLLKTLGSRARRDLLRNPQLARRPSFFLQLANRELLALGLDKHATLVCGVLDPAARRLYWAMAGHLPQPVVFDGKTAKYLAGKGMPVGLFDGAVYEDRMHALPERYVLAVFSDGVLELLSGRTLAEKESALLSLVGGGACDVEALGRALHLEAGRELPDDVALLVIRNTVAGNAGST